MLPALVPDDVTRLLAERGQRVAASVGTDGAWWVTCPVDDLDAPGLEVQVARVPADDHLRALADALTRVRHPHLVAVREVVPLDAGRVAVLTAHVPGPTLAAVRAARPPLTDAEAVTVAVPVAQALAALHDAGLAHGTVAADRVVLRPDGFPVLVDLRGVLAGAGTADGDVRRLIATVLGVLPPLEAELAAGLPELTRLRDALEDVARRGAPAAADVVDAAFGAAEPAPVHMPDPDALAGAQVALDAGRSLPRGAPTPEVTRRARRPRRRRAVRAGVTVLVLATLAALAVVGVTALREGAAPVPDAVRGGAGAAAEATPGRAADDPAAAAADLTRRRAVALAAASADGVAALHVAGSPSFAHDVALLDQLAGARSDGLTVAVHDAVVSGRTPDGDAVVLVTSSVGSHTRVSTAGERTTVPATAARTVELVLRRTGEGWRVWDVRERAGNPS
ncbi:hypothetical protein [Cellulomonas shaoxiangyii]|uniref:Protein kinase domain-containing protein n=1 Tax=Cellulomonas shaoxiangyii TaxID=2566013 RepID=A0A4P7SHD9_9CELL|nr:hypothetical protein [Cellulomonas shaoxiangyii]QCB93380.1 hypothetical protein E5225_07235 [Cellulomonas shaoxiangyii]TGY85342.1 hypothetical protein E5226_07160 [Cellulomonas shaoxiangyii]